MDNAAAKIELLDSGRVPIYEPGLQELVQRNRREGRLTFTTNMLQATRSAQIIFVAVGTPQSEDGSADLTNLWSLADSLAEVLNGPKIIVLKSTVPVGTNQALAL